MPQYAYVIPLQRELYWLPVSIWVNSRWPIKPILARDGQFARLPAHSNKIRQREHVQAPNA